MQGMQLHRDAHSPGRGVVRVFAQPCGQEAPQRVLWRKYLIILCQSEFA
jgi:hypothetical protein